MGAEFRAFYAIFAEIMEQNKPIDGAEYITLEDANDQFILQGKVTSIHRDTRKYWYVRHRRLW